MNTAFLIKLLNVITLLAMMLSIGLSVQLDQVIAATRNIRMTMLGVAANFVLVPMLTVGLLILFQPDPMVSAGFLILAVCPGAPVGPAFTALAKGSVAVATGLMIVLAGLSACLSPPLLSFLLSRIVPEGKLQIDYLTIVQILLTSQLLPLSVGLGIRWRSPGIAEKMVKPIGLLANVLLLVLVGMIVATQYEFLAAIRLRGWAGITLLLIGSLGIGWICGGRDLANRKAMAMTAAVRNVAVGLVIAGSNFSGTPAVTAVVAYGLYSMVGALGAAFLCSKFPRRGQTDPYLDGSSGLAGNT